jgi:hypothetical protein
MTADKALNASSTDVARRMENLAQTWSQSALHPGSSALESKGCAKTG